VRGASVCATLLAGLATAASAQPAGDPVAGRAAYEARCGGCHSVDADRVGPRHAGLIGRRAGSVPGYDYSPALARSRLVWDARNLDRWLQNPEALIPGQQMGYRLEDAAVRADIVAFLGTLRASGR
jgi:cytochrome c